METDKDGDREVSDRFDLEVLVLGKKSGLTLEEINLFRVQDLLDYSNIYAGTAKDKPRKATQADIDKFYA